MTSVGPTIISVDSSGHAGQPPIVMLATKITSKGQSHVALVVDDATHSTYEDCTVDWREKLAAVLIFHAVLPIFGPNHDIIIDFDFNSANRRMRVDQYLRRLFGKKFFGHPSLSNPPISWATIENPHIKLADKKASLARQKKISRRPAPELMKEIRSL